MWPDATQTSELVLRAKEGDPAAVEKLLARHREGLRRMVELRLDRAVAARVDVSDVLQDTMVEVSRRLAEYLKDPSMPFHLWIRHIARDRIIDAHRRHRAAGRRSVDREQGPAGPALSGESSVQILNQLAAEGLTPAAQAMRKELEARCEAAIAKLDEDDREVILMRHVEQLSNQEVAQALGLSEPAAGMRHLRALRRLRDLLGESSGP